MPILRRTTLILRQEFIRYLLHISGDRSVFTSGDRKILCNSDRSGTVQEKFRSVIVIRTIEQTLLCIRSRHINIFYFSDVSRRFCLSILTHGQ